MQGTDEHPNVAEARARCARHLAELQRVHLELAADTRSLKAFGDGGSGLAEIQVTYEVLEQYLSMSDAFLENMRGRYETRLGLLRHTEPLLDGKPHHPDLAPGHAFFWLEFSRLTSVLRRIARRAEL